MPPVELSIDIGVVNQNISFFLALEKCSWSPGSYKSYAFHEEIWVVKKKLMKITWISVKGEILQQKCWHASRYMDTIMDLLQ